MVRPSLRAIQSTPLAIGSSTFEVFVIVNLMVTGSLIGTDQSICRQLNLDRIDCEFPLDSRCAETSNVHPKERSSAPVAMCVFTIPSLLFNRDAERVGSYIAGSAFIPDFLLHAHEVYTGTIHKIKIRDVFLGRYALACI
jgi:hypothetical protein